MTFDFDEFAALAKTDPQEFERRRSELIDAEIAKAPLARQPKLRVLQEELDTARSVLDSKDFIAYCVDRVHVNLDDLEDQFRCVAVLLEK